jgi:hypothetical protein
VAYAARRLAHVEKHRGRPFGEADAARILAELRSPDDVVRAKAVRQVCPCRVSWEVFDHLRKVVHHLQRDPSPLVRAHARHVEEDAKEVRALEVLWERVQETEEDADALRWTGCTDGGSDAGVAPSQSDVGSPGTASFIWSEAHAGGRARVRR